MYCKDCEREVNKLTKLGICDYCYTRLKNDEYRGIEHKPLKDLKGTSIYKIFVHKFGLVNPENTIPKEKNLNKESIIQEVAEDVKKVFQQREINSSYLDFNIQQFIDLLDNCDSMIENAEKAEKAFDGISYDYLHLIEGSEWGSPESLRAQLKEKALLELRRPTKDIIYKFRIIKPFIEYIKNNIELKSIIDDLKHDIEQLNHRDLTYKLRNPIENELGYETKYKAYYVEVPCFNYNGNPGMDYFKNNKPTYARSPEEAKAIFIKFLDQYFSTLVYKESDIKVREWQEGD